MSWVSEQRLADQANTTRRKSLMSVRELRWKEKNLAEIDSYREEKRSADDSS